MKLKVEMPLIKNLSVNHYLIKAKHGVFKRKEVKDWQDELGWKVKPAHIEDWKRPLKVTCDLVQNDNRTRDLSNFSKVILDALQEVSTVNDSEMRWHDGVIFKGFVPRLIITIEEE